MYGMTLASERTLCFLVRGKEILLTRKLLRLGAGKYNGYGGGLDSGESPEHAAIRELCEESTVDAKESDLEKRAVIDFFFPHEPHNNQRVHIYFLHDWSGVPDRTEEMDVPQWFSINNLPYDEMWASDKEWWPYLMQGHRIKGYFIWTKDRQVAEKKIDIVESLVD
jgi:8-oxo-dGTP pyrophosphatase MutT (NUDIX family)